MTDAQGRTDSARPPWWRRLAIVIPVALVLTVIAVLAAKGIRALPAAQEFLDNYPGRSDLPTGAPVGLPAWLNWSHFLNSFFMLFIISTGWELRQKKRPAVFWTRTNTGLLRTKNAPIRIGLPLWFHYSVNTLWVLNGVVLYALLFSTGQWVRTIPTSLDVIPNALSAALQYASLGWPSDNGWNNYNSLQLLAYFATTFIAAPLAIITGLRLAPGFAGRLRRLDRVLPLRATRSIHVATMVYFVAFIIVHVTLVLTTGAVRNLNHMYAVRDDESWFGLGFFATSIVVMIVAWFLARPSLLVRVAERTGTIRR